MKDGYLLGHSVMDLDCLGSLVLARYIYPDLIPLQPRHFHPLAKNLYNLYERELEFLPIKDVKEKNPSNLVVVDTRRVRKIKDWLDSFDSIPPQIRIYDHHVAMACDIPGGELIEKPYGANVTLLLEEIIAQGIFLTPSVATIALAGLYSDTGYFGHENVHVQDFQAASFLMESGGDLSLVNHLLEPLKHDAGKKLLYETLKGITTHDIKGYSVIAAFTPMEEMVPGLSALADKLMSLEHPDLMILVYEGPKKAVVIVRSSIRDMNLPEILEDYGLKGHGGAASVTLNAPLEKDYLQKLLRTLESRTLKGHSAAQLMVRQVGCILESWSLMEASMFLEGIDHSGAPVINTKGQLTGFMTLKDIMKGRKSGNMKAPVTAYMTRKVHSAHKDWSFRQIEEEFFMKNVGHLPVIDDNREVIGIITRTDYLKVLRGE